MLRKSRMDEILIDCSFKLYSMAPKFDPLIQRYAILIHRSRDQGPTQYDTAPTMITRYAGIARDHTYLFISWQLLSEMRKYVRT
jgi:hypothetical protein